MSLDTSLSRQVLFNASSNFFGGSRQGKDLGTGSDIFFQSGSLKPGSKNYFRFDSSGSNLNVILTGKDGAKLQGNLDLQIFDAAGIEVSRSNQTGTAIEEITLANLDSDTFFIVLTNDTDQPIPYESEASNNTTSELIEKEKTGLDFNRVIQDTVSDRDTSDFYPFSLTRTSNLQIVLDEPQYLKTPRGTNASVRLILDKNNDRLVQQSGEEINFTSSQENGNKRTFFFTNLAPSQHYYVQVFSDGGATLYELKVTSTTATSLTANALAFTSGDSGLSDALVFNTGISTQSIAPVAEALPIAVSADLRGLTANPSSTDSELLNNPNGVRFSANWVGSDVDISTSLLTAQPLEPVEDFTII
jgi:hypothetical protein